MSIFEKQVQFNDCDAGPEPSLRRIIELYYMEHFNEQDALHLTERLIHSLLFELVLENKQVLKDAHRYRWLRDPDRNVSQVLDKVTGYVEYHEGTNTGGYSTYEYRAGEDLDNAIDKAMEASA